MGTDEQGRTGPNRRDFLKATGAAALVTSIAGCDQLPDEGTENTDGTGTGGGTGTDPGTGDGTTTSDEPPTDESNPFVAEPAAVNPEFTAERSDLVRSAFTEEYYTRIEGAIPGLDAPEGVTPTGHVVSYGHAAESVGGDPPDRPTLDVLSAGTLSLPAPDGASNAFAEASLSELVRMEEGNLLLGAAGLSTRTEWVSDPVSVDRREAAVLDGEGVVETFVGAVRAAPGPGMPDGETAGFFGDGDLPPGQFMTTVHVARTFVGGSLVMMGMVGGWQRPPTMGPPPTEMGPETKGLLSDVYDDIIRTALFVDVLGEIGMLVASRLPDEDERPPPPKEGGVKRASYSRTIGLDDDDQVELGYPNEDTFDDLATNGFTVGRDVPGLLALEPYDPEKHSRGTSYLVRAETRTAAYTLADDDGTTIPFGVAASKPIQVEGEERNPMVIESLSDLVGSFEPVWDLLRRTGDYDDFSWKGTPSQVSSVSGPNLLGTSGETKAFEGPIETESDGTTTTVEATLYVTRVQTSDEVVIATALSETEGTGHFAQSETVKAQFDECVRRTVYDPDPLNDWVDASVDDLNLVQIVRNTRLETASGDVLGQPDPPLVKQRYTAPPFDVSTWSGTALSAYDDPLHGVFQFDVGNRSERFETVLGQSALGDLDSNNVDPDALFDGNRQDGDPDTDLPVFELQGGDTSVTVGARAPSGYLYDTRTVSEGSDYSITDLDVLRVGFITVTDPEDGANYGDSNGEPTNYETTVDAAFEFLKRTYPAGIAAYRHDNAIDGVTFALNDNATKNDTRDYRNARVALERIAKPGNNNWSYSGDTLTHKISESDAESDIRANGFDVWVLIVPNGYYQFHVDDGTPSGLAPYNDDLAVTAVEGARNGRPSAAETVAQEIGHRIEDEPYRNPATGNGQNNPLSQRDDGGTDVANRDFDHARHLSSNNDGSTPTDVPGVVSRAYSLAEGEFVVPNASIWNGGYDIQSISNFPIWTPGYGPSNDTARLGRMESYMSYSGRRVWTDSLITRDVIESDFKRESGNYQTFQVAGGLDEVQLSPSGASVRTLAEEEKTITGMQVFEDWAPTPDEERLAEADSVIQVSMFGPEGTVVAETRTLPEEGVDGHEVEDGTLDGDTSFSIEFPPDAVEMTVDRENVSLRANPVTRPIRTAYEDLPPAAFTDDPAVARDRIVTLASTVDEQMSAGQYGAARDELQTYAETTLPADLNPEFEPKANEFGRDRLGWLFDHMIARLDGLAGEESDEEDVTAGDPPAWAQWVPEPSSLPVFADTRVLWQYSVSGVLNARAGDLGVTESDPMTNPAIAALAASLSWSELGGLGVAEPVLGPAVSETNVDPAEVPAEVGILVGNTHVFLGSFDVGRLEEAIAAADFTETDTPGVYAHGSSELVLAYGESYVLAGETVEAVARLRATGAGEVERWVEASEEVAWLLGAGAAGDFTLATHRGEETITDDTGESVDLSPFVGASGLAQSLSVDGSGATDGTAALVYPPETPPEMDRLRETLGVEAADRTFTSEGRFVTVEADYEG